MVDTMFNPCRRQWITSVTSTDGSEGRRRTDNMRQANASMIEDRLNQEDGTVKEFPPSFLERNGPTDIVHSSALLDY